jgi:hypothetical protein
MKRRLLSLLVLGSCCVVLGTLLGFTPPAHALCEGCTIMFCGDITVAGVRCYVSTEISGITCDSTMGPCAERCWWVPSSCSNQEGGGPKPIPGGTGSIEHPRTEPADTPSFLSSSSSPTSVELRRPTDRSSVTDCSAPAERHVVTVVEEARV